VGSESDLRFLYCACCICHMLQDWGHISKTKAVSYIRSCRSWDGAFALIPGQEGHGGSTFCAIASLVLMDRLDDVLATDGGWRKDLIRWCVHRQECGLQGRPNKDEDSCYSYWIGGTLCLLGEDHLLDTRRLQGFVLQCQTNLGGFSKFIGKAPDILHAFYSMAYLSLSQRQVDDDDDDDNRSQDFQLKELNCLLGIYSDRAATFDPEESTYLKY
jgi:geranylgeranyl transferase type-1 subunit beta